MNNLSREDGKNRANINLANKKVEKLMEGLDQFLPVEVDALKDIANIKWEEMTERVDKLAKEVLAEVMEHEMALARLESFDFREVIPEEAQMKDRKSLLNRMSSL